MLAQGLQLVTGVRTGWLDGPQGHVDLDTPLDRSGLAIVRRDLSEPDDQGNARTGIDQERDSKLSTRLDNAPLCVENRTYLP